MKPSKATQEAAVEIYSKYERYLGAEHMGNQDEDCCIHTIADIISRHLDGPPAYLVEALNSGDGTYRP